jgi:hypothetical protein
MLLRYLLIDSAKIRARSTALPVDDTADTYIISAILA